MTITKLCEAFFYEKKLVNPLDISTFDINSYCILAEIQNDLKLGCDSRLLCF